MAKYGPRVGTTYPHRWVSGPDPILHKKYRIWLQQRNQANFREEGWDFSFEEWVAVWGEDFMSRGRGSSDLCMIRTDRDEPWTKHNVEIVTRKEHMQRQQPISVESRHRNKLFRKV